MEVREACVVQPQAAISLHRNNISHLPDIALIDGLFTENQPVYFPVEETLNFATSYFAESGFTFPRFDIERSPLDYVVLYHLLYNSPPKERF